MSKTFVACKQRVANRGRAPDAFLEALVDWAKTADDEIFTVNGIYDIYSSVAADLGPWNGLRHRKAVMLEVLRVLGGFESSWDWEEGVDVNNPTSNTPCTEEAGVFQCSGNSMSFDGSLKQLLQTETGKSDCKTFISETKRNHAFALEYCARLLRFTVKHHGPVKRKEINEWLRRDAVAEFEDRLK